MGGSDRVLFDTDTPCKWPACSDPESTRQS